MGSKDPEQSRIDILCLAAKKRLCPGFTVEEVATRFANDGEFSNDFTRARSAISEELENQTILPTFMPSSEVERVSSYGHFVYEKAALIPESLIFSTFKKSADQLGLKKWTSETQLTKEYCNILGLCLCFFGYVPVYILRTCGMRCILFHQGINSWT